MSLTWRPVKEKDGASDQRLVHTHYMTKIESTLVCVEHDVHYPRCCITRVSPVPKSHTTPGNCSFWIPPLWMPVRLHRRDGSTSE